MIDVTVDGMAELGLLCNRGQDYILQDPTHLITVQPGIYFQSTI